MPNNSNMQRALVGPSATSVSRGTFISSQSTGLFVANKNSKVLTTGSAGLVSSRINPYGTAGSNTTYETNAVVVSRPGDFTYLDLHHFYAGLADPSTPLQVRVFGFLPLQKTTDASSTPNACNPLLQSVLHSYYRSASAVRGQQGFWVPLMDPSTRELVLQFDTAAAVQQDVTDMGSSIDQLLGVPVSEAIPGDISFSQSKPRTVFLGGCTHVVVHVVQAANQAGAGMVLGAFNS